MYHHALHGPRPYWIWLAVLVALIAIGASAWLRQLDAGLAVTGLGRDVTWGLYIAQFTFLVGVAASAVMVVLPCYLHDVKAFARVTILGESLAVAAVTCAILFIAVDLGQPSRLLNVVLYPTPSSPMFWDMIALGGYLALNAVIARATLAAERHDIAPPAWVKPLVLLSIPWAVSIHTVTAMLYSGLPGRSYWLTALLAPRFLASAFAAGPALLILLAMVLRRVARYDVGQPAIRTLAVTVTYAMLAHAFFLLMELFTALYAGIPDHVNNVRYLFVGLDGHATLVPWMWTSVSLTAVALVLLLVSRLRANPRVLAAAALLVILALWIDKGLALIVGGLVPTPLDAVVDYVPTVTEAAIAAGVWALGALMVTLMVKIVVGVRQQTGARDHRAEVGEVTAPVHGAGPAPAEGPSWSA